MKQRDVILNLALEGGNLTITQRAEIPRHWQIAYVGLSPVSGGTYLETSRGNTRTFANIETALGVAHEMLRLAHRSPSVRVDWYTPRTSS
jgi:hypothetical protein